jgi:hypothetical protein
MEADPDLLKADIAPLLKHITPSIIQDILNELNQVELITLYEVSGRSYLQLTQFEKNQRNLRKDKEAPSRIPGPTPDLLRSKDGPSTELVGDKRREEKRSLREAEGGVGETKPPLDNPGPVDNPKPKSALLEKEPDALMDSLMEITTDIGTFITNPMDQRQIMLFVESNILKKNHAALLHCLKSLQKNLHNGTEIRSPRQYLEAALKIEDGKHNARENEERSNRFKRETPGIMSIGDILKNAVTA